MGKFKKMRVAKLTALLWLVFIFSFVLGVVTYITETWPYPLINEIETFVKGHPEERTNLMQKIENDFGVKPSRHIFEMKDDYSKYQDYEQIKNLPRNDKPKLYLTDKAPKGYRVIFGTFDFKESLHAAILLGPEGKVEHIWHVSQEDVDWKHKSDNNVYSHGFEIAPDGSIVVAYDGGTSLTKYDYCGNIIWRTKGGFHHSIEFEDDKYIWSWAGLSPALSMGHFLVKIDYKTGEIVKKFHLSDVMEANADIDIFGSRQKDSSDKSTWVDRGLERWHPNDIDPLPEELSSHYSRFEAGDLLVSLRAPNLIFVMDPDTLKVKWWRQGLTRRQHDPDWNDKGTITIFNNNMHRGFSSIIELNPLNFDYEYIVEGEKYDFYTWMRGKHQLVPNNGYLITSSQQGRVFEVDEQGEVVFDFINSYGKKKEALVVSEAAFLPLDFFNELPKCD